MNDVPSLYDLVLVCIIPEPRDLEIAKLLGWYRIPLKHAPKIIQVDFLAFYQPGSFGKEHCWKIEYLAPVNGVELVKRKDLFTEEKEIQKSEDEYYKIILGDLIKLNSPIKAVSWKRITFFYTIGKLFHDANLLIVFSFNDKTYFSQE